MAQSAQLSQTEYDRLKAYIIEKVSVFIFYRIQNDHGFISRIIINKNYINFC